MSITKTHRTQKRQRGQFLTPQTLAREILSGMEFRATDRVLEPGFGNGSFLIPLIDRFMELYDGSLLERLEKVLTRNLWGIEIDPALYKETLFNIEEQIGPLPVFNNLLVGDFFDTPLSSGTLRCDSASGSFISEIEFTYIVGNPPFGGTIASRLQDPLDRVLGWRHGMKIKKETYSWFIVKSMDLLAPGGRLRFICSNTFLTISTMKGLRNALAKEGQATVWPLERFSDETSYPMVVLDWVKNGVSTYVSVDGCPVAMSDIDRTANLSWGLVLELVPYFRGPSLGDVMIATSGMTTGNNDLFVRKIEEGTLTECYRFNFAQVPITLESELRKARLGRLSRHKTRQIAAIEAQGVNQRELAPERLLNPVEVKLPHSDYVPYNKATKGLVYCRPTHYIYWKDDGDAVITYKKTGNWYLRGVGGARFFGREGLTWRLISHSLDVRFLPAGYILDSGAPCAFPRPGVTQEEMLFVMGWTLTAKCTRLLKQVINHTMNIQGKDFERLPYPFWVDSERRVEAIALVMSMIDDGLGGRTFKRQDAEFDALASLYRMT